MMHVRLTSSSGLVGLISAWVTPEMKFFHSEWWVLAGCTAFGSPLLTSWSRDIDTEPFLSSKDSIIFSNVERVFVAIGSCIWSPIPTWLWTLGIPIGAALWVCLESGPRTLSSEVEEMLWGYLHCIVVCVCLRAVNKQLWLFWRGLGTQRSGKSTNQWCKQI